MTQDFSNLKRDRHPMPAFIRDALVKSGRMKEYLQRPAYQQNDYIGWIERAKKLATKEKRLAQMLNELEVVGVYMGMKHPASEKRKSAGGRV